MERTILLKLDDEQDAILVEKATGEDTPETLGARIIAEWCQPFVNANHTAILRELSKNEDWVALRSEVAKSPPETQAAVIAAARAVLDAE